MTGKPDLHLAEILMDRVQGDVESADCVHELLYNITPALLVKEVADLRKDHALSAQRLGVLLRTKILTRLCTVHLQLGAQDFLNIVS
jgi:hypothetical protein